MSFSGDWKSDLLYGKKAPRPCTENAIVLLMQHPAWAGKLHYCVRRRVPVLTEDVGRWCRRGTWNDNTTTGFISWSARCLEGDGGNAGPGVMFTHRLVDPVVALVAAQSTFDPVKEYLEGLEWDGIPRLDYFLTLYCGTPEKPEYTVPGRKWLIQAVARVFEPGCQADYALVLESPQGEHKTSLFRTLGNGWQIEHSGALTTRDAIIELHAAWIVEMADLASLRGTRDIEAVKAMLTKRSDSFTQKYQTYSTTWLRRFVFAGTVNPSGGGEWIADPTGGRRFWPIPVSKIQIAAIEDWRDHLWAEAVVRYKEGEPWWVQDPTTQAAMAVVQEERTEKDDVWREQVEQFLVQQPVWSDAERRFVWTDRARALTSVTVRQIAVEALGMKIEAVNKTVQMRVANVLRSIGLKRRENVIRNGKIGCYWEIE